MARKPNAAKKSPKKPQQPPVAQPKVPVVETPPVSTPAAEPPEPAKVDTPSPDVKEAVEKSKENFTAIQQALGQAQSLIKEGKSKADAARAIYGLLKDQGKEVVIAAFVNGAGLTPKGAVTYWYNCKRRAEKEERAVAKA